MRITPRVETTFVTPRKHGPRPGYYPTRRDADRAEQKEWDRFLAQRAATPDRPVRASTSGASWWYCRGPKGEWGPHLAIPAQSRDPNRCSECDTPKPDGVRLTT